MLSEQHNEETETYELPKVNADINSKKRIFAQWCSFLIVTLVYYLCLLAIPDSFTSVGAPLCSSYDGAAFLDYSCRIERKREFNESPRVAYIVPELTQDNTFLIVYLSFKYRSAIQTRITLNYTYTIQIYSVEFDDSKVTLDQELIDESHYSLITCNPGNVEDYLDCDQLIAYYPQIKHSNYLVYMSAG